MGIYPTNKFDKISESLIKKYDLLSELSEEDRAEYLKLEWTSALWEAIWKSLPEKAEQKLNEYRNKLQIALSKKIWDIPVGLQYYRMGWKEKIKSCGSTPLKKKDLDNDVKEKIVNSVSKIPVVISENPNNYRVIELMIWDDTYKILDPSFSWDFMDDNYSETYSYSIYSNFYKDWYHFLNKWVWWNDIEQWENKKLKEFVKDREKEWFHIPSKEEIKDLLHKLWDIAGLDNEEDEMAMLMYLTWMKWKYRLSMWNNSKNEEVHDQLSCFDEGRSFKSRPKNSWVGNLLMIRKNN